MAAKDPLLARQAVKYTRFSSQISRRVAACAKVARIGERFSGHSGRIGMAITMPDGQAPGTKIMRQDRRAPQRMVLRFGRNETASEALRLMSQFGEAKEARIGRTMHRWARQTGGKERKRRWHDGQGADGGFPDRRPRRRGPGIPSYSRH